MLKKYILPAVATLALILASVALFVVLSNTKSLGSSGPMSIRTPYDLIGTATTGATLTTAYTGNSTTMYVGYLENLKLDVKYTPGATNQYAYILVEGSNDGGTTYFPMSGKSVGATEIDLFIKDTDGNLGIPVIFPGDKVSATTSVYYGTTDFDMVADWIRVSAKESGTATGTIYIRGTATTK